MAATTLKFIQCTYDFAVHGGAVGTIVFNNTLLPNNVCVFAFPFRWIQVLTPLASGGAATITWGTSLSTSAFNSSAQGFATYSNPAVLNIVGQIIAFYTAGAAPLAMTINVAPLTAGKLNWTVGYYESALYTI